MTHKTNNHRTGLTLAEVLVATTITTIVLAAAGAFTHAVMDGWKASSTTADATQASRVVLARIAHKVSTSRQVLRPTKPNSTTRQCLLVWERDGEAGDPTPGQPNFVELVIYAPSKTQPGQLLELRPQVDPALVVPLNKSSTLEQWLDRFRSGQDIAQPPEILLYDLGGIRFNVQEYSEPQGIAGAVQQDILIRLCIAPRDQQPTVFFGSTARRYVTGT